MEVDAAILAEFTLDTVQYDGWIELTHHLKRCDWTADVSCDSLYAIVRKAEEHAGDCDGTPQPRPPVTPSPNGDLIPKIWFREIEAQCRRNFASKEEAWNALTSSFSRFST